MSEKTRRDQVRDYLVMWIDFMLWGACDERPRKERWQAARFSEGESIRATDSGDKALRARQGEHSRDSRRT
ncbi:hypothetical protein CVT26_015799 [Gymnopilus dilepis]|uniref:Uncharacterized protein n=1 Tax=Gymnopilus dilepis TaxID=231916 RepID=A0A409W4I3_9AGAR|nr:hypothetical protein CVT26_015799 [Gymnopilus dilepis]